ncbi:hypothetical protein ACGFZR_02125 [Streptomyces sp. NPDC048241]|uniref:hypothetical protein n=1 Tax=Streptomyces sp. NPDC048241 TaxID=3365521 RepID=UPI003712ED01
MRRTVRALSTAAALAGATLAIAGPASAESGAPCEDPAASAPRSPGSSYEGTGTGQGNGAPTGTGQGSGGPAPGAPYLGAAPDPGGKAPTAPAWSGAEGCAGGSAGKTGQGGDDPARQGGDEDGDEGGGDWDSGPAKDAPPTVEHGVQAGAGGTFTDSVPALAAGGALIAAAAAGAGYRVLGRRRPAGR